MVDGDQIVAALLAYVDSRVERVHLVVLGGSAGEAAGAYSDLDIFLFCDDNGLDRTIDDLCEWMLRTQGSTSVKHGPFLRDEFGIGYRFLVSGRIRVELYFITSAIWIAVPSQGKGTIAYQRTSPQAEEWKDRLRRCREEFPPSFIEEQTLVWVTKIQKYLRRKDRLAACWHALKFHQALLALERTLDGNDRLEPYHSFRTPTNRLEREHARIETDMIQLILEAPEVALPQLLDKARDTFSKVAGSAAALARLQRRDGDGSAQPASIPAPTLEGEVTSDIDAQAGIGGMEKLESVENVNRRHWNEITRLNVSSGFYDVECLTDGRSSLTTPELEELDSLDDLEGLHLQCGIGIDTLSLARLGANVVGVDFSTESIQVARGFAATLGLPVRFEVADVLVPDCLHGESFDFIYTSHGVLRWLSNLEPWASNIFRLLKPSGFFYMFEIHPLVFRLQELRDGRAVLGGDYFYERAVVKDSAHTHAVTLPDGITTKLVHTDWSVSSIIGALLRAGLILEFFHEHQGASYSRKGVLSRCPDGLWHSPSGPTPIPLSFSIRAVRPV